MRRNLVVQQVPNLVTLANLACGSLGIVYALTHTYENFWNAAYFILLAGIFDFLDGFVARLLKVSSELGKQLDSLSDVVSFGVLPGVLVQVLLFHILPENLEFLKYIFLLIPLMSSYRLARFNLETHGGTHFIGLPTPANAFFWAGVVLMYGGMTRAVEVFIPYPLVILGVIFLSYLLVSDIEMFSLKFKKWHWRANRMQYLFLLMTGLLVFAFERTMHWAVSLPVTIGVYISFSIALHWTKKNHFFELKK